MRFEMPPFSIGMVIALVVLVLVVVLLVLDEPLDAHVVLGLIGALALARIT